MWPVNAQSLPGSGNSLTFNGFSSYVNCGTADRGIVSNLTVEAWIKTTSSAGQFAVTKYSNSLFSDSGFEFGTTGGRAGIFGRAGVGMYLSSGLSSTLVNDGRWHHLAGQVADNVWRIYVDGELENSTTYPYSAGDLRTPEVMTIGTYTYLTNFYFTGDIDEVRVWRTARTQAEIRATMCKKFAAAPLDLVAYYRFDEKPVPDYEALLEGGVAGLRIGLALPNDGPAPLDAKIGAAVQAAADTLGKLGAKITMAKLPDFTALYSCAEVLVKCEAAAMHRPWMEKTPELYANQVRTRMEAGFFIPATQYIDALRLRAHFVTEFLAMAMNGVDAVLLPAIPFPIPTLEETDTENKGGPAVLKMVAGFTGLTRPFNTLGIPALSVPCGFTTSGLPVGMQIIARAGADAQVLRVGYAFQQATNWHERMPRL